MCKLLHLRESCSQLMVAHPPRLQVVAQYRRMHVTALIVGMIAGSSQWPRCTLAYSPPELAHAVDASRRVTVSAAHDVWALAVMAYEAVAQQQVLHMTGQVFECALGAAQYPWECPEEAQPPAWRQSRLRAVLLPCLSRDTTARPSAAALLERVTCLGHETPSAGRK